MSIPIKIQCGCGQRYAFEVEAVDGRMPAPVACPSCGADGTAAANSVIAQSVAAQVAVAPASGQEVRLRATAPAQVAGAPPGVFAVHLRPAPAPAIHLAAPTTPAPAAAPRKAALLPGQLERTQAEHEARAKVFWGDPPEEVIKFLMRQGIDYEEAASLIGPMYQERITTVRGIGIRKMLTGGGMVCVPIVALVFFLSIGFIELKSFACTVVVGLWGLWRAIQGLIMFFSPKSESGDVADK